MASIKDVAKLAGVSTATVSRVINGGMNVTEGTIAQVKSAVEKLNYTPNNLGLALRKSETNIIMLYSKLHLVYSRDFLRGMYDAAEENGFYIMSSVTNGSEKMEQELLDRAEKKLVDGVIFVAGGFSTRELMEMNSRFPLVLASSYMSDAVPSVSIDPEKAGYDVTAFLLKHGRKKIAIIGMTADEKYQYLDDRLRFKGYRMALDEYKIEYDPGLVISGDFTYESGYSSVTDLIDSGIAFDGLITTHDGVALGCINAIRDKGLKVPDDIAVITIDASDMCEMSRPQITALAQPWYEIGRRSVLSIIEQKKLGKEYEPHAVFLDHKITERQST